MRKILFTLALIFSSCTFAGEYATQFKSDILNYNFEQSKTPNKIIKYTDPNGNFVRAVLSPKINTVQIISEMLAAGENSDDIMAQHKLILKNYVDAFKKHPGEYDLEYLDSLEQIVHNNLRAYINIQKMNSDPSIDEAQKNIMNGMKPILKMTAFALINGHQQDIKNKKFSSEYTQLAKDKLILFYNQTTQIFEADN